MSAPLPSPSRSWVAHAVHVLREDATAQRTTPLIDLPVPSGWGVQIVAKDERVHPTGSLKHRLARSLFLHAVVDGEIGPNTTVVEASSGSTAISEAYFARELGVPFIAVVPDGTSPHKIALIQGFGGVVRYVSDASEASATSRAIAAELGGHFMDQFTNASRVTDWTGDANLAGELVGQLGDRRHPIPSWVVVGAGTGGTSAMLGRYFRSRRLETRIALADPEGSAYFGRIARAQLPTRVSRIEGIGRTVVEPSFVPSVIDTAFRVDDAQSVAAMELFNEMTGQACGPSTGTNLVVALYVALGMRARGERGTVATVICDGADRYTDTYYSQEWLTANGMDPSPYAQPLRTALLTGVWSHALSPVATPDWSAVN